MGKVQIRNLDSKNVGDLIDVYNAQLTGVPHCHPVSPDEFHALGASDKDLQPQVIIIGELGGVIVGFADVIVVSNIDEEGQEEQQGLIRMLTYRPGCRRAGQALLEEAERYLKDLGQKRVKVFRISYKNEHIYPFYNLGFGLVSDRTTHLCALFRINDYKVCGGEIFLDWPRYEMDEPKTPDCSVDISVEKVEGQGDLPGLTVQALRNGSELGVCRSRSAGEQCRASSAQDWIFIKWLGVEEGTRATGWGRYLLNRNLWEARKLGYKNAVISCDVKNPRAQLFYTNYGFKVVNTSYGFTKTL